MYIIIPKKKIGHNQKETTWDPLGVVCWAHQLVFVMADPSLWPPALAVGFPKDKRRTTVIPALFTWIAARVVKIVRHSLLGRSCGLPFGSGIRRKSFGTWRVYSTWLPGVISEVSESIQALVPKLRHMQPPNSLTFRAPSFEAQGFKRGLRAEVFEVRQFSQKLALQESGSISEWLRV